MKRLAIRLMVVCVAMALALVLLFTWLPLTWLASVLGDDDIVVLAGSRFSRGQALVDGQQWISWQWCPEQGLAVICATLNGENQYVSAELHSGFAGITAQAVTFSGISMVKFGLRSLGPDAVLAGKIDSVFLPWREPCLKDLVTIDATLSASRLGFSTLSGKVVNVAIQGNGNDGVTVRGETAWGDFRLVEGMMQGTLEIARDVVPQSAAGMLKQTASGYAFDISQRIPCQGER